jgi:hypothetical protein
MLFPSLLSLGDGLFVLSFSSSAEMALWNKRASALVSSGPLTGARRG